MVVSVDGTINTCIDLFYSIIENNMMKTHKVEKVPDGMYNLLVFPQTIKDKLMCNDCKDYLRVKGKLKQINPMDKPDVINDILAVIK